MNLLSYLHDVINDTTQFFIFDSHESADENIYEDKTYKEYHYSTKRYGKVNCGDIFVYRRPQRTSENKKFYLFGGGVIDAILPKQNGNEGDVIAKITHTFEFDKPLYQGDSELENYEWESKKKKPGSWAHFWGQYGMNLILKEDFMNLFGMMECSRAIEEIKPKSIDESDSEFEEREEVECSAENFKLEFDDDFSKDINISNATNGHNNSRVVKMDFNKANEYKLKIGDLGEKLVMQLETLKLKNTNFEPNHVAKEKGDGLGYDVLSYSNDGEEIKIEVKTTISNNVDGFYMSPNELKVAGECGDSYYIYRVYNLDLKRGTGRIKIYKWNSIRDKFNIKPTEFKITLKR